MFLLTLLAYYLLIGLLFAIAFFWRGYAIIAPAATGASIWVRLVWLPAAVGLWPLLARKWWVRRGRG